MKDLNAERPEFYDCYDAMLCFCKHPALDLTLKSPGVVDQQACNTPCDDAPEGYAQDTATWD